MTLAPGGSNIHLRHSMLHIIAYMLSEQNHGDRNIYISAYDSLAIIYLGARTKSRKKPISTT